jgi:hypothetical protein
MVGKCGRNVVQTPIHAAKMLKLYNINSNRTVEVLYFFNDMICMYNLITF